MGREGREVRFRDGGRTGGAEVGARPHQGGGGPPSARGHPRRVPPHGHPEDVPQRVDRGGHLRQRGNALGRAQRRIAVHALPRRPRRLHPLLERQPHQEHARPPAGAAGRLFERLSVPLLVPAARPDQGEGSRARLLARDADRLGRDGRHRGRDRQVRRGRASEGCDVVARRDHELGRAGGCAAYGFSRRR